MAEWKILDLWKIHQIYIYISSCSHVLTTYSRQIYTVYSLMQCGNPSHVCGIIIPLFNPSNKQKQCRYIPKNTPKKKPCTSLHVTQLYHYIIYKQFANLTMDYFEGTSTGNHLCLPNMLMVRSESYKFYNIVWPKLNLSAYPFTWPMFNPKPTDFKCSFLFILSVPWRNFGFYQTWIQFTNICPADSLVSSPPMDGSHSPSRIAGTGHQTWLTLEKTYERIYGHSK
jgi:hypothetical protein